MDRMEVAAWTQVAVGVIGLVLAALTATPAINAVLQSAAGTGAAGSFRSAQGAIQLFAIILVVATCIVFVSIGLAVILGRLFSIIQAASPYHAAFCIVVAMLLVSAATVLGLLGSQYWVWPILQAVLCVILAGQGQVDPGKETFWSLMIVGTAIAFAVGVWGSGFFANSPVVPPTPSAAQTQAGAR